jgi:S1/P1 Nuclease
VNIPINPMAGDPKGYDLTRDCPRGDCVVAKIEEFERVLSDRQKPDRERLEALKYIVHFVGDVHQPLHASNDNDRGGNNVAVTFMGLPTNLHAVWDTGIIAPAVRGDERRYALQLVREITQAKRRRWSRGDPVAWANESYRIAVRTVYGRMAHSDTLPEEYEFAALPIANEQLERAGVRLAAVLNETLK